MTIKLTTLKQSLNAAYRLVKPQRSAIDKFKDGLNTLLQRIDVEESEENVKIHLMDFLKNTWYTPDYLIATKGRTDFVIHTGTATRSCPWVPTIRARVNSPTLSVLLIFCPLNVA